MFDPSSLTPVVAGAEDARAKVAALLAGVSGQLRDIADDPRLIRKYLDALDAEAPALVDAVELPPVIEPVFEAAPQLTAALEEATDAPPPAIGTLSNTLEPMGEEHHPLDHDGDGKLGGSLPGDQSTAAKGARRKKGETE